MKPNVFILRTAGTNCDGETAHAFELAGGTPTFVHVNRLLENPKQLHEFQILAFPGGFSYGDDIAAGKILATQLTQHLGDVLRVSGSGEDRPAAGADRGKGRPDGDAGAQRKRSIHGQMDSSRAAGREVHLDARHCPVGFTDRARRREVRPGR